MQGIRTEKTIPVSIRLSADERSRLEADAGSQSLSEYIRARLFGGTARERRVQTTTTNARQLAHILAALGASELGPNLRELVHAARIGALPITPDTVEALTAACTATIEIRNGLMTALGLVERAHDDP